MAVNGAFGLSNEALHAPGNAHTLTVHSCVVQNTPLQQQQQRLSAWPTSLHRLTASPSLQHTHVHLRARREPRTLDGRAESIRLARSIRGEGQLERRML